MCKVKAKKIHSKIWGGFKYNMPQGKIRGAKILALQIQIRQKITLKAICTVESILNYHLDHAIKV